MTKSDQHGRSADSDPSSYLTAKVANTPTVEAYIPRNPLFPGDPFDFTKDFGNFVLRPLRATRPFQRCTPPFDSSFRHLFQTPTITSSRDQCRRHLPIKAILSDARGGFGGLQLLPCSMAKSAIPRSLEPKRNIPSEHFPLSRETFHKLPTRKQRMDLLGGAFFVRLRGTTCQMSIPPHFVLCHQL